MALTSDQAQALVHIASEARQQAYAPYSGYPVGAAVLTKTGRTFTGVNVENAAFPQTMCAERTAIFAAITAGEREFDAIAVVTSNGGSPCGGCRQVMAEFGLDTIVICADDRGHVVSQLTVRELLPEAFTPGQLSAGA